MLASSVAHAGDRCGAGGRGREGGRPTRRRHTLHQRGGALASPSREQGAARATHTCHGVVGPTRLWLLFAVQVVEDHMTACRIADASSATELVFVVMSGAIPSTPRVTSALLPETDTHTVHLDKRQGPIGITVCDRTPKPHSRPIGAGVLVTGLTPTGLAMASGLQIGDCIVAVNGVHVRRIRSLL